MGRFGTILFYSLPSFLAQLISLLEGRARSLAADDEAANLRKQALGDLFPGGVVPLHHEDALFRGCYRKGQQP